MGGDTIPVWIRVRSPSVVRGTNSFEGDKKGKEERERDSQSRDLNMFCLNQMKMRSQRC